MTLIELVIVLAILSSLATMAITGADQMVSNKRIDDSVARGRMICEAINGDGLQASRFVNDMGRLPLNVDRNNDGSELKELWLANKTAIEFGNTQWNPGGSLDEKWDDDQSIYPELPVNGEISLDCGWRGPYISVTNPNTFKIYDGYGNPWGILETDGSKLGKNEEIVRFKSYGKNDTNDDDTVPSDIYETDIEYIFNTIDTSDLTITISTPLSTILSDHYTSLRATLFIPEISHKKKEVSSLHFNWQFPVTDTSKTGNYYEGDAAVDCIGSNFSQIKYYDLTPGTRKLYIYGYGATVAGSCGVIELDIKPGHNATTVILIENRWL